MSRSILRAISGAGATAAGAGTTISSTKRASAHERSKSPLEVVERHADHDSDWTSLSLRERLAAPILRDEIQETFESLFSSSPPRAPLKNGDPSGSASLRVEEIATVTDSLVIDPAPYRVSEDGQSDAASDQGSDTNAVLASAELPYPSHVVHLQLPQEQVELVQEMAVAMSEDSNLVSAILENPRLRAWMERVTHHPPMLTAGPQDAAPEGFAASGAASSSAMPRLPPRPSKQLHPVDQFFTDLGHHVVKAAAFVGGFVRDRAEEVGGFLKDRAQDAAEILDSLFDDLMAPPRPSSSEATVRRAEGTEEGAQGTAGREDKRKDKNLARPLIAAGVFILAVLLMRRVGLRPKIAIV